MSKNIRLLARKICSGLFKFLGLSSLFSFLGCNSIIGIFTGNGPYVCMYGVPANMIEINGTVYGDIDGDGKKEPVSGIKVSSGLQNDEVYTDSKGHFYYSTINDNDSLTLTFTDTDGAKNGDFKTFSKEFNLLNSKYYPDEEIELNNK